MADRSCGSCNLCCKVLDVREIDKMAGAWCAHAKPGKGCGIYGSHPSQCQTFKCLWLEDTNIPEDWKPSKSKFVIHADGGENKICIDVDVDAPNAWRKEPYYSEFKRWSQIIANGQGVVIVYVGKRCWVLFPEEDLSVGDVVFGDDLVAGYLTSGMFRYPAARVERGGITTEYVSPRFPA